MRKQLFILSLVLSLFTFSYSADLVVTNLNDSGAGSLRQAIADASDGDAINFSITGTITLASHLEIGKSLTINGPGASNLTISGSDLCRVFNVTGSGDLTIKNLTVSNGRSNIIGGGIYVLNGNLTVDNCTIRNCSCCSINLGLGGGVYLETGSLVIRDSIISGNSSDSDGGGICVDSARFVVIERCSITGNHAILGAGIVCRSSYISGFPFLLRDTTISDNSADYNGGGVLIEGGSCDIVNSTVSGNSAQEGAGIYINGTNNAAADQVFIISSTITANSASNSGGGIESDYNFYISNSILAANICTGSGGANFEGVGILISLGYNLCDSHLAQLNSTGDIQNGTLNIGSLADNGGTTYTHKLLAGSDAIDAIPSTNSYNGAPGNDQIGTSRPQGTHADIGACELPVELEVTTQAVSGIVSTSATANGNITSMGVPDPTSHGFCWNTTGNPVITDSHTDEGAVSSTGPFTSLITGLAPDTEYYVRAYASNSTGVTYGEQVFFRTEPNATPVRTYEVTDIDENSAHAGGVVIKNSDEKILRRGVCWSTDPYPRISGQHIDSGRGYGEFYGTITGLNPSTVYNVRAYAVNSSGVFYGRPVSFRTMDELPQINILSPGQEEVLEGEVVLRACTVTEAEPVRFFADNHLLGKGIVEKYENKEKMFEIIFDISNAEFFFINRDKQLMKISDKGEVHSVFNTNIRVEDININERGMVRVKLFDSILLEDYTETKILSIDLFNGEVYGKGMFPDIVKKRFIKGLQPLSSCKTTFSYNEVQREINRSEREYILDMSEKLLVCSLNNSGKYRWYRVNRHNDSSEVLCETDEIPEGIVRNVLLYDFVRFTKIDFRIFDCDEKEDAKVVYKYIWDTSGNPDGEYTVKAESEDKYSRLFSDERKITVKNLKITLDVSEIRDSAYSFNFSLPYIRFEVSGADNADINKYSVFRKTGAGDYTLIREIKCQELKNNCFEFCDKDAGSGSEYIYIVKAYKKSGDVAAQSEEGKIRI